jgi:hypothetical protein
LTRRLNLVLLAVNRKLIRIKALPRTHPDLSEEQLFFTARGKKALYRGAGACYLFRKLENIVA